MSRTVHYRGVATKIEQPKNKTLFEMARAILKDRNKEIASYYDNPVECLCSEFESEFFYHSEKHALYEVTRNEHDLEEEIIRAEKKEDNTIEYELRYYNGGAGFAECLEQAFNKLDLKTQTK